jgi:hypothetical protein
MILQKQQLRGSPNTARVAARLKTAAGAIATAVIRRAAVCVAIASNSRASPAAARRFPATQLSVILLSQLGGRALKRRELRPQGMVLRHGRWCTTNGYRQQRECKRRPVGTEHWIPFQSDSISHDAPTAYVARQPPFP